MRELATIGLLALACVAFGLLGRRRMRCESHPSCAESTCDGCDILEPNDA